MDCRSRRILLGSIKVLLSLKVWQQMQQQQQQQ
jgi:hypothetical protein